MTFDDFRPFIAKILSPIFGALFAWMATKYGIIIDEKTHAEIVFAVAAIISGVAAVIINKKVNPGNMANTTLAAHAKAVVEDKNLRDDIREATEKAGLNPESKDV